LFAYGPADATVIPKRRHLLPHLNPDWFYLSGTGLPRLSWKRGLRFLVVSNERSSRIAYVLSSHSSQSLRVALKKPGARRSKVLMMMSTKNYQLRKTTKLTEIFDSVPLTVFAGT